MKSDRGAFFKSIMGTLNHILVGDIIWLKRFQSHPAHATALAYLNEIDHPPALDSLLFDDIANLKVARQTIDELMINWIAGLSESDLGDSLSYTDTSGNPHRKSVESLISHLFLHQTHHRGQITTLISQSDADFGETDLLEIIVEQPAPHLESACKP